MRITKYFSIYKMVVSTLLTIFSLLSIVYAKTLNDTGALLISFATPFLIFAPTVFCIIFKLQTGNILFTALSLYAVSPLLGSVYNMYDIFPQFDSLLHFTGGVVFAIIGYFLAGIINKGYNTLLISALFAFFFSVAVAGLWELYEFGCDSFFGTDMQVNTYLESGCVDIGLIDSMIDMLVETVGALLFTVFALIDKDRHPIFKKI